MDVVGQFAQCFQKQLNGKDAARAFTSPMARQVHGDCVKAPLAQGTRNWPHLTYMCRRERQKKEHGGNGRVCEVLGDVDRSAPSTRSANRQ